ncbi:MAG TPA: hypothetical protein VF800_24120 [Telluria sp.]|jgi:FtsH-binding integral membrane protein
MMTPETKRELRALFKNIVLVCVLLAIATGLFLYYIASPNMQSVFVLLATLGAGGSGYYFASVAPLWVAAPWLKGLLCVVAILAGVGTFAMAGAVSLFGYEVVAGKPSSGGASKGFRSWD